MAYLQGNGEIHEIDEFAMFRARAHGMESEYLEMARVRRQGANETTAQLTGGSSREGRSQRGAAENQSSLERQSTVDENNASPGTVRRRNVSTRRGHSQRDDDEDVTTALIANPQVG